MKNTVYEVRIKHGMTQEELAHAVGVSRQTVIAIERGNYTPSVSLALKIANIFTIKVESLFSLAYEK